MTFVRPELLWLLALSVPLGAAVWLAVARRRRLLARFAGDRSHSQRFLGQVSAHRRAVKLLLLVLSAVLAVFALARPQWGTRLTDIRRQGFDVVLLLDTSLSMAAEDIAPSRLGQARHEIGNLLKRVAGNRVGLVTFAGEATLTCPLTPDHEAVRLFLDAVDVEAVPVPGTALAGALELAVRAFGGTTGDPDAPGRAIVLFSDGEDHGGGVAEHAARLQRAGVRLFAVGCGTVRGAPIPLRNAEGTVLGYKKDREDKIVTTRLFEDDLRTLALESGGRYFRATPDETEIEEIAGALGEMDAREFGATLRPRYEERFQWPLGLALLALIGETLLGDRKREGRA